MKKLFDNIKKSNIEKVSQIIEKNPELVNCVSENLTKRDEGQSPLQIAIKTENTAIANYLLDMGADVNFISNEKTSNRKPVIHNAIEYAVMSSRWNERFLEYSTKEKAVEALGILKKMLDMGADVKALDFYGISGLGCFVQRAKKILPTYNYAEEREEDDRIFTTEVHEDLKNVLKALKDAGADLSELDEFREACSDGAIAILLDEVYGGNMESHADLESEFEIGIKLNKDQAEKIFADNAVFVKDRDVIEAHVAKELLGPDAYAFARTGGPGETYNAYSIGSYTLHYLTKEGFLMGVTYNNVQAYKKAHPDE